jgi:ribonuclease HI
MILAETAPVERYGSERDTTNQRMELRAAIEGLKLLGEPSRVTLHSDSAYLINGMNQRWHERWQENGWKTAKRKPVKNADLWQELVRLDEFHAVEWIKVKGHSGVPANERCDYLVQVAIQEAEKAR